MRNTLKTLEWISRHRREVHLAMPLLLLLMVGSVTALVYLSGGIKFVYSHSMYFPILLAGLVFGAKGGVLVALLGGLVLGPFMPIDVASGERQETINWLFRTGFFVMVGFINGVASDIVRAYLRHIKWVNQHDIASGLPNRNALFERISRISRPSKKIRKNTLLVLSLVNAMELKSAFGYSVIEDIIIQLAQRLNNVLGLSGAVYRVDTVQLGLLIRYKSGEKIEEGLSPLVDSCRQPFIYQGVPIHADFRLGYVSFEKACEEPEIYLQMAESAVVMAYESVQDCVHYSSGGDASARENMTVLGELLYALEDGQLSLHYQPKVDIATGHVGGAEALMRWCHPQKGNIPPGIFIPRAEQSTLIEMLTRFALEQAMKQAKAWQDRGIRFPLAVNISSRNLLQPGFTDQVLMLLDRYSLKGDQLELEVTESALMMDVDRTIGELNRLAKAGITLSIDDFGTGYSSLQYLHKLPVSLLKVDQSFVSRMQTDAQAAHIIEAAVGLAHKMDMKVIAEGVESSPVYRMLGDIGCDMAQGYMISRPVAAADFEIWFNDCSGHFQRPAA
jgi:diguanylate cyclase